MGASGRPPEDSADSVWPYIGVGCLTAIVGFFGGGMIAALVARVVGAMQGCKPPEGFPACNTWSFVLPGMLIGALGLPIAAVRRLKKGRMRNGNETR